MKPRTGRTADLQPALDPAAMTLAGPQAPSSEAQPDRIGRYLVLRTVGHGGMGVVYAAYDPQLDRKIAIKRLLVASPTAQQRMRREAQALARLSHPNVVSVYEVDFDEGGAYLAMAFIAGVSLRVWLGERVREVPEILGAFMQAGRGLAAAHAAGLMHRDFKPDNALVDNRGHVYVCDFGLARAPGAAAEATDIVTTSEAAAESSGVLSRSMTQSGAVLGTPAYMAPEQHAGLAADARADIYSFCVSLYEALYGERPFVGEDLAARKSQRLSRPPADRGVPTWLHAVVARGLDPDPARRWPDMEGLLAALGRDPIAARRRRLLLAGRTALVAALTGCTLLAATTLQRGCAHAQREARAAERLAVVEAKIRDDLAAGRRAEAEADFAAFVDGEEQRGTSSLSRAYLHRGERRAGRAEVDAALDDFATAYARASTPELAQEALRALARGFRRTWSSDQLGRVLAMLDAEGVVDGELAGLRVEQALMARDLKGAAQALARPEAAGSPLQGLGPALAAWANGGPSALTGTLLRVVEFRGERVLSVVNDRRLELHSLTPTLPLLAVYISPVTIDQVLERGGWVAAAEEGELRVLDLTRAEPERLRAPFAGDLYFAAEADLAGDGAVDLYLGPGDGARGFYVVDDVYGAARAPRPAHAATHAAGPDFEAAQRVDLDGDGRPELLAAFGAWTAYDLRAFRAGADGELERVARARVGRPNGVGVLRGADGADRIAVIADEVFANPDLFPAPPAAVHLLRRDPGLAELATLELPRRADGSGFHVTAGPLIGDIDGDGREDLVVGLTGTIPASAELMTMIYRQQPDGSFVGGALLGLMPCLMVELDGDPGPELLARDRDYHIWALGLGERPLARVSTPTPASRPAPPELAADGWLSERWQRTEELAALGMHAGAFRDLEQAARLSAEPARRVLLDRAADHAVVAGDDLAVLELGRRLGDDPAHAARIDLRTAGALLRLGRFADAGRLVRAQAGAELGRDAADGLTLRALGEFETVGAGERRFELPAHGGIDPAWEVWIPESIRRDTPRALHLELMGSDTRTLGIPLLWPGGPLGVEFELELEHVEWGGELRVGLVDAAGRPWIGGGTGGSGGAGRVRQSLSCVLRDHQWTRTHELPLAAAGEPRRLRVRLGVLPRTRQGFCVFEIDGAIKREIFELGATPLPGRYNLVFGTFSEAAAGTRASGYVRGLVVDGAVADPTRAHDRDLGPCRVAAHRLADGDPGGALTALASAPTCGREHALLRGLALGALGDVGGAGAAFAAVLAEGEPALVARVHDALRRAPALALAAQEAMGAEHLTVAAPIWRQLVHHHRHDAEIDRIALAALAGVERVRPETPAQVQAYATLLVQRGLLWARLGALDRAQGDLDEGLRLGPAPEVATQAQLQLVRLHAADPARAGAYARAALAGATDPDNLRLMLRGDPALAGLRGDPGWSALVAGP